MLLQSIKDMVARRSFDKYCPTRDGYQAKAFKPPKYWDFAGKMYGTHISQSVNVPAAYATIVYDKHLHGRNLAKIGTSPMDCVCELCGGEDSELHHQGFFFDILLSLIK